MLRRFAGRREGKQLGLLRHKCDVKCRTILGRKVDQTSQPDDTVGDQDCIISLADGGNCGSPTVNS